MHAIALRIEELGLRDGFYEEWRRAIWRRYKDAPLKVVEEGQDEPEESDEADEKIIFRPSSARKLLTRFGYRLPLIFRSAIEKNFLSPLDGERLIGLSSNSLSRATKIAEQEFGKDI